MNGMSSCLGSLFLLALSFFSSQSLALSYEFGVIDKSLAVTGNSGLNVSEELKVGKGLRASQKLLISVPDAQLTVTHKNQPKLRIELNEAAESEYQVTQEGDLMMVRLRESGKNSDAKKKMIEVSGPSVGLEVHIGQGDVQLKDWLQEALLHVQKGKIIAHRNRNDLILHVLSGEIEVQQQQGRIEIDSFKAGVQIRDLQGDLKLDNFMGDSVIDSVKGALALSQGQGNLKLTKGAGSLQFDQTKGVINILQFSGRVEGVSQEGPVNVVMSSETDVNVRSQGGKVTVHAPPAGGILLNLASQDGEIYAPTYLKVVREGSQKSLRARLKGEAQKGSIFVRTAEGAIFVR